MIQLRHYLQDCTITSIYKKSEPGQEESETCRCIVFTVVRESEPCHEKSQPGQEKSETFLNCAIHATAGMRCVVGDSFDLSYSNSVE